MPEGIRINQITAGHAKEFHEKLKAKGMATIAPLDACQQTNGTATRIPAACRLLLAWQLTTYCPAELSAGYRG